MPAQLAIDLHLICRNMELPLTIETHFLSFGPRNVLKLWNTALAIRF